MADTPATGRPRIEIDWVDFDKLCGMQATLDEIAAWFNCSEDTIERRVSEEKGMRFAEYKAQKAARGRISLRRAQMQKALDGNVVMQIWLGKQYLGQKDKQEISGDEFAPVTLMYVPKSQRT